ncbi:MarR family winged helix-turn-helix transcriptional regulator [Leucobacter aridicollis]|uniref:DNA-binding MarR family transcriptional regulator n=1 Tax=Leucobacter aridicollis TaxID=283878 RepID=A0A852RC50_9MICO|nr:MarR family winged helix-turn-helix transcriptional regulator [Leucobacter aridicollis]MBL3683021.1 MarR family transcriptional regulator [Leucobacter aridicollis]NYD26460.1 DNA-binding MarR family transcriptional regulator [Leucobacter aridicollis]
MWIDDAGAEREDAVLPDWWFTHFAYGQLPEHFPGVDAEASRLVMRMRRATGTIGEFARAEHGSRTGELSTAGQRIMLTLALCGPLTQSDIAGLTGMSRAAVSSAVRTLLADGMISRETSPHDGRAVVHTATEAGLETYQRVFLERNQRESKLLQALTPDDQSHLMEILEKLMRVAAEETGQGITRAPTEPAR